MIREKAIKKLKDILEEATETDDSVCYVTADDADALKAAINSLEYEQAEPKTDVLDKIRDEIIDKYMTATGDVNTVAKGCLQIIDKYKAESEDKEL